MKQILISTLFLFLISCGEKPAVEPQSSETIVENISTPDSVTDAATGATNNSVELMLNGTMTIPPQSNVTISLPIDGIVTSFLHLPGNFVNKGDVVVVLENSEFIDIQQNYLDAAAQSEFLEAEYKRQNTLAQQDVTSQKRLQQSKADYLSAKSRKEAMAAKLSMLGVGVSALEKSGIIEKLEVKAPQNGYISDVMVNQGKFVAAGDAICQIINKTQILLNLIAYEKDLKQVKTGQKIQFKANGLGDEVFTATITAIDQRVDPVNRSVKVYAKADVTNSDFRPGMYVMAMVK